MAQITIQQVFDLALQRHQAGRLQEAEQFYRQVLTRQPDHAGALHYLGLIAHQAGQNAAAVDLIRRSLILMPNWAEVHSNLANILQASGQLDEAIAQCHQALSLKPNLAEAHNNLGNALLEKGDWDEAIVACRRALALRAGYIEAQFNLGNALRAKGQLDEAIAAYRKVLGWKPDYPEAYNNLGDALIAKGQLDEAIAALGQALALRPGYSQAHNNLGIVLQAKGQLQEALTAYRQALALNSLYPEANNNLGNALKDLGQLEEAIAAYRQAISLKPNYFQAHSNLGNALRAAGELDGAIAACQKAIAIQPGFPQAHYNLATALLTRGDFEPGWDEYEWRTKLPDFVAPWRNIAQPQWDGGDLNGKTILIYTEQGLGDGFQMARYVPMVAARGGPIVIVCHKSQIGLMRNLLGVIDAIGSDRPQPRGDVFVSMMSLPKIFGTTARSIPTDVPYLKVDPIRVEAWRTRISEYAGFKVGLVWKGKPTPDPLRSCPLAELAPLGSVPGTQFFSLQIEQGSQETNPSSEELRLVDLSAELVDFVETAACIVNLDLVITIDTAVAHLAGALGRATWTLLPVSPDWRWMHDREDSPWYPTMRLFRQTRHNQWTDVVARVKEELRSFFAA